MKRFLLMIALLGTLITPSYAGVKGVQWILLSNAAPNDAEQFLRVFDDGHGRYTRGPSTIEIAFAPYIYGSSLNKYQNAQRLINALTPYKTVWIKVFLDFHTLEGNPGNAIAANAQDFNNNFLRPNAANPRIKWFLSPSLEDHLSNTRFDWIVGRMKPQIASALLPRITLCRSGIENHGVSALGFGGAVSEVHGQINGSYADYSNDGNLVYDAAQNEDSNSLPGSNPPQYELRSFMTQTGRIGSNVMLWRPAMNLLRKNRSGSKYYYSNTGRIFNNTYSAMDGAEITVLKLFFGT